MGIFGVEKLRPNEIKIEQIINEVKIHAPEYKDRIVTINLDYLDFNNEKDEKLLGLYKIIFEIIEYYSIFDKFHLRNKDNRANSIIETISHTKSSFYFYLNPDRTYIDIRYNDRRTIELFKDYNLNKEEKTIYFNEILFGENYSYVTKFLEFVKSKVESDLIFFYKNNYFGMEIDMSFIETIKDPKCEHCQTSFFDNLNEKISKLFFWRKKEDAVLSLK